MNVRLLRQLSFLALVVTTAFLKAMHFPSLSAIERMLVARAIQQRGIDAVRQDIESAEDSKGTCYEDWRSGEHYLKGPTVLSVDVVLKKEDVETDPLAKAVFEEIQKDYCSEVKMAREPSFIGHNTRYNWLEEKGADIPDVKIKARLTNKQELKGIVDTYN